MGIAEALPEQASAQAKHIIQDSLPRQAQALDIKSVYGGSKIDQVITVFSLFSNNGDRCELVLNEPGLNQYTISNIFICDDINTVPLKLKGLHALQTKLDRDTFNFKVWSIDQRAFVAIDSDSVSLDIDYTLPSYFAKIENNIVIGVLVATPDHISTLSGSYIETTKNNIHSKFAGIGDTYDQTNNRFIPLPPFDSWILDGDTWHAPEEYPQDGSIYVWNENSLSWVFVQ